MNFKKRVNGSWHDAPHYVHNTSTDTITTLPADIYPNAATATVGLKGQTVQSGTPTPQNPVMPQETGERTENLAPPLIDWVDGYVAANGRISEPSETYKEKSSDYFLIDAGKAYTFSMENGFPGGTDYSWRAIGWYAQDKTFISRASGMNNVALSTNAPSNAVYCRLSYRTHGETMNSMLNTGSTALPYEPYGYKIPISSANTTTPVYLGEVESTRRIKKLVLDGTEDGWREGTGFFYNQQISPDYKHSANNITLMCTHYQPYKQVAQGGNIPNGYCSFYYDPAFQRLYFVDNSINTLADWKSYLAAQYAAGTPVTVWYVLATETTGIVNEPLRKIGDYADEVSNVATIPTITGKDTFDVDVTLKPSEVELTYTGWHDATVKEFNGTTWE